MLFKGGWFEIFYSWFSFSLNATQAGGCSLRIKCQNPDVQINVKFQAISNLQYLTINGSVWTYAWTTSPVWPLAAPFASLWRWCTRTLAGRPRRSEVILFLRFCHRQTPWCSRSQGQQSVQKEEGKKGGFHRQICVHMQFEHASECVFSFVEVSFQGEVGYGGKERNPFMYYQMFPFRNSTLFSILSLKRMCSRLYPAC